MKLRIITIALVLTSAFLSLCVPATAAEVRCLIQGGFTEKNLEEVRRMQAKSPDIKTPTQHTCSHILVQGPIVGGDAERVRLLVARSSPWVHTLSISSPGGDIIEAMKVGRVVRRGLMDVRPPFAYNGPGTKATLMMPGDTTKDLCEEKPKQPCVCASACFFIWAAGAERLTGVVAIHRPYPTQAAARNHSIREFESQYGAVLAEVRQYLSDVGVPPSLYERMLRVPSEKIQFLTYDEQEMVIGNYSPALREYLKAMCPFFSEDDEAEVHNLTTRRYLGRLTSRETELLAIQEELRRRHSVCVNETKINQRSRER